MPNLDAIAIYNLNAWPELRGGSEISCKELAQELHAQGMRVSLVSLQPFSKGFSTLHMGRIPVHKLPLLNVFWPLGRSRGRAARLAWKVIDSLNLPMAALIAIFLKFKGIRVVHTNNLVGASPWLFPMLRLFGMRVVHTTRDFYLLDRQSWYRNDNDDPNSLLLRASRMYKRFCAKFVDQVVFNSRYMEQVHSRFDVFRRAPSVVIYNGFRRPKPSVENSVASPREFQFGFIGRFSEQKGIDLLIESFARFPIGSARLRIAGGTVDELKALYPRLAAVIESRHDIEFAGFVESREFYEHVDCVVVPSRFNEPFGRVAMEAMFAGCFVLVSSRGGLPEQILDPSDGIVVDGNDFFPAMEQALKRTRMRRCFSEKAHLSRFRIEHSVAEYRRVFLQVAERGR